MSDTTWTLFDWGVFVGVGGTGVFVGKGGTGVFVGKGGTGVFVGAGVFVGGGVFVGAAVLVAVAPKRLLVAEFVRPGLAQLVEMLLVPVFSGFELAGVSAVPARDERTTAQTTVIARTPTATILPTRGLYLSRASDRPAQGRRRRPDRFSHR